MRPPLVPQSIPIYDHDVLHIKTLKTLYNTLVEHRELKTGRIVVQLFMCLPSRKDFPEYFDIIAKPISMYEIRKRIESNQYRNEEACIEDFKLMFNNCKIFNEDFSVIFQDAVKLQDILLRKYERILYETGRSTGPYGHDSKSSSATTAAPPNQTTPKATPTRRAERLNHSNSVHNNHATNKAASAAAAVTSATNNGDISYSSSPIPHSKFNHDNSTSATQNHNQFLTSTPGPNSNNQSSTNKYFNDNGVTSEQDNSNLNNFSSCNGTDSGLKRNHDYHNETSVDSSSNLSMGTIASTDKSKRAKKDPDAPKRRLLTGYIIYAAEVRKEYVDKHPNQDFGFISRLIGNDWRGLNRDLRTKYDQRALAHNKRVRERALKDSMLETPDGQPPPTEIQTPKLSKKKLAKLAKEQARLQKSGINLSVQESPSSNQTSARYPEHPSPYVVSRPSMNHLHRNIYAPQRMSQSTPGQTFLVDSETQTAPIRFVEPVNRRRPAYSENFRRYIESLEVPNVDLLAEETATPERVGTEPVTNWLGSTGIGRHESPEAALWALRDFMLQDAATMRWSMQPYLCY